MQLLTERLILREFEERDAAETNEYERDPQVVRYQSSGPRTLEESLQYLRTSMATAREVPRRTFDFAVILREGGRLIGRVGLQVKDPEIREGALWYVLHPAFWGNGYAVEACHMLLAFGYGKLGLHRVFVDCDPANAASLRVAEKLRMRREAHFVENAWIKGAWVDTVICALLDREWKAAQGG